jgi:lipoprotein-anchoring transpeptidase ErfK/SrfK
MKAAAALALLVLTVVVLSCGSSDAGPSAGSAGVTLAPVQGAALGRAPATVTAGTGSAAAATGRVAPTVREFIPGYGPLAVGLTGPATLRVHPNGPVVAHVASLTEFGSPRVYPVVARRGRWVAVVATEVPNGARAWMRLGPRAELFRPGWSVTIDVTQRSLVVRHLGRIVRRTTVGVGDSGTPTPLGLFGVTDKLIVTGGTSPYGYGALALTGHQPHVPQGWGGGDRIAVHGTQNPYSIGQAASLGCLRATRADVVWLVNHVPLGTRVRIGT